MQGIMDKLHQKKQMTLKERLIQQKQERLNQNFLIRQEDKRHVPTSLPYAEGEKKKPSKNGTFYKFVNPTIVTDAFKTATNTDIERIKNAHVRASNLGPGINDRSVDTFRLLKKDP